MANRMPAWLLYSLATVIFWGAWGATSKVVSDRLNLAANQALFTVGLAPVAWFCLSRKAISQTTTQSSRGRFWAFMTGVLGGLGNIALFKSLGSGGPVSVVVPLSSIYALITILIALVFLKERVSTYQKIGAGIGLAAIYLLSL